MTEKRLEAFCVAKVAKYTVNQLKEHRLIFISDISLDGSLNAMSKIGNPVNVENDPGVPAPPQLSGPVAPNAASSVNINSVVAEVPVNMPKQPTPAMASKPLVQPITASSTDDLTIQPISAISPYHNRFATLAY